MLGAPNGWVSLPDFRREQAPRGSGYPADGKFRPGKVARKSAWRWKCSGSETGPGMLATPMENSRPARDIPHSLAPDVCQGYFSVFRMNRCGNEQTYPPRLAILNDVQNGCNRFIMRPDWTVARGEGDEGNQRRGNSAGLQQGEAVSGAHKP